MTFTPSIRLRGAGLLLVPKTAGGADGTSPQQANRGHGGCLLGEMSDEENRE